MRIARGVLISSCLALASAIGGCGTDAMGTDACRKIEQARCRRAATCPTVALQGATGVEECTQFARDSCLHGLAVSDPGPAVVDLCVSAIEHAATCDLVLAPASSPACAFLQPAPTPDAGPDATDETDGGAEAANDDGPTEGG